MHKDILNSYKEILDFGKKIKAAIEKKDWEQVTFLVSQRDEPVQKIVFFLSQNKDLDPELNEQIQQFVSQIKELDNENIQAIEENKRLIDLNLRKIKLGKKALKGYKN